MPEDVTHELLRESSSGPGEVVARVAKAKPAKELTEQLASLLAWFSAPNQDNSIGYISKPLAYGALFRHQMKRFHADTIRLLKGGYLRVVLVPGPPLDGTLAKRDAPYGTKWYMIEPTEKQMPKTKRNPSRKGALEPNIWVEREDLEDEISTSRMIHGPTKPAWGMGGANDWIPLYVIPEASGSDYSGGTAEKSNYQVLQELREEHQMPELIAFYGGHGTYGIAVRLDKPLSAEVKEILDGLEGYAVIDEDHLSNLESEAEQKQWDSWGRREWRDELRKAFDDDYEDVIDDLEDSELDELWQEVAGDLSWTVEFETGGGAIFNFKEAIEKLPDDALDEYDE